MPAGADIPSRHRGGEDQGTEMENASLSLGLGQEISSFGSSMDDWPVKRQIIRLISATLRRIIRMIITYANATRQIKKKIVSGRLERDPISDNEMRSFPRSTMFERLVDILGYGPTRERAVEHVFRRNSGEMGESGCPKRGREVFERVDSDVPAEPF